MKTQSLAILCLGALALSPTLASCDSEARLAENITGTWAATPEKLIDSDAMSATAIRIIQFNPDADNNKGGDLQMTALVSITNAMSNKTPAIIESYTVSASGIATLTGEWAAVEDDKVSLHLDESTLKVSVDPEAVLVSVNTLTDATISTPDSIKPIIADHLKQQITIAVRNQIFDINAIDDIKITNNLMSCEINKRDYTLRRQDIPVK